MAPHRVPERDQAEDGEAGDEVVHARHRHDPAQQLRREAAEHAVLPGGLALQLALGDDQIGAALDPADQVGDDLRVVGEVRVHEDRRVPLGPVGQLDRGPEQLLDRRGVAPALGVPHDA